MLQNFIFRGFFFFFSKKLFTKTVRDLLHGSVQLNIFSMILEELVFSYVVGACVQT